MEDSSRRLEGSIEVISEKIAMLEEAGGFYEMISGIVERVETREQ